MVAAGDHVHTRPIDLIRNPGGNAISAGGVFPIGNDKIQPVILTQGWHQRFDSPSPRFADDVANEEKFHHLKLIERLVRARKSGV
jgi:hypothetical protein